MSFFAFFFCKLKKKKKKRRKQFSSFPHHGPHDPPQRPEDRRRVQEPEGVEPLRVVKLEHVEDAGEDPGGERERECKN